MRKTVKVDIHDSHIVMITLDNQPANAFSLRLLDDLNQVLFDVEQSDCRVVIFRGSGQKVFCAGADLKEREKMTDEEAVATVRKIKETITRIEQLSMPTIASMNGVAFGGGLELALACDIRISSEEIQMGLTETSLGIIPGAGGTQRLARLIGIGKAKYLIFTAKRLTGREAKDIGIVEEVTTQEKLEDLTLQVARDIASNGPIGVKQAKKAIQDGIQADLATGLKIEESCYMATIPTADRMEGLRAFKEKRKPQYKGE
ncbi:enoyl-CoA hydratase [Salirhabdus salicampi]|uniref:enoyl-CoA hydratase n=1 Tax=Salirhabdus salicampi TaxID=476102 RepID=UPI0020C31F76|nr:enoyl-CoA hydratase [Salirhabdus salicampi]MCP8616385.1 enoyl-CoA hydratase [Salirhabdus salicampi]